MRLILASASPRRRELLTQLGVGFEVCPASADESLLPGEGPVEAALRLARLKAFTVAADFPGAVVIAADTLVAVDGQILGKPDGRDVMERHLRTLSGRTHQVVTGLHVLDAATGRSAAAAEITEVDFDGLAETEIRWYLDSGEGRDKAGSYGYQGLAAVLVNGIRGCYFNVVGLPLSRLRKLLAELGHDLLADADLRGGRR